MIIREKLKNGTEKIYSDTGKKIRQIESNRIYSVAHEKSRKYTYEEV